MFRVRNFQERGRTKVTLTKSHGETYDTEAFGATKSFNVEELKVRETTLYVNISSFVASFVNLFCFVL